MGKCCGSSITDEHGRDFRKHMKDLDDSRET